MATIDIDRDTARDAAENELQRPIYAKPSAGDYVLEWIDDLISRIARAGSTVPGGWFTLTVVAILVVLAVVTAVRIARRTMHTQRAGDAVLFGDRELSSAEHSAAAERYAAEGQFGPAIRHRLRAVARHLEETGVLQPIPGRTATELAADTGRVFPQLADEFDTAATIFNDITYGDRPASPQDYRRVVALDDHLRSQPHPVAAATTAPPATSGWAEVR